MGTSAELRGGSVRGDDDRGERRIWQRSVLHSEMEFVKRLFCGI